MLDIYTTLATTGTILIHPLTPQQYQLWLSTQNDFVTNYCALQKFTADSASVCVIPKTDGHIDQVLLGLENEEDFWSFGVLPKQLPKGIYQIADLQDEALFRAQLAFGLGAYQYTHYKTHQPIEAQLLVEQQALLDHWLQAIYLGRDLVNTPFDDMNPVHLEQAAMQLAERFSASCHSIVGEQLLDDNYPTIYAVGKGSLFAPRLIDLRWGDEKAPKLTLVGKGVCFDTGGMDIKPASNMRYMKKDMGGAAHVLALAHLIMSENLPVRLRVLIPAVHNATSDQAMHPGDVIRTRQGTTVEVHNTDAEGRLILCDALAEAASETPDLLIDVATLTGAARVALGPDIPVFFTHQSALAHEVMQVAEQALETVWQLPLYAPYKEYLSSSIADIANAGTTPFAGCITAALYLKEFVPDAIKWLHFDVLAYNFQARPGRPEGGEMQGLRTLYQLIKTHLRG